MRRRFLGFGVVVMVGVSGLCAVAASRAGDGQETPVRVVRMTAERFTFTPAEVAVDAGVEVEFRLRSDDTLHGFRIAGHAIDVAIPKRGRGETTVRFTPPGPGRYVFECSRMCGAGHGFMRGTLIVRERGGAR